MTKDNIHRSGSAETSGFIVEWRLKDGIKLVYGDRYLDRYPSHDWLQAPYDIERMRLDVQTSRLIKPVISEWDGGSNPFAISRYGLVRKPVADAIIACFKTMIIADPVLSAAEDFIELRARECSLNYSFKVEYVSEDVLEKKAESTY